MGISKEVFENQVLELLGPGLNAIDAEKKIQQRPCQRKQQTYRNPAQSGPGITFEQKDVAGGQNGDQKMQEKQHPM